MIFFCRTVVCRPYDQKRPTKQILIFLCVTCSLHRWYWYLGKLSWYSWNQKISGPSHGISRILFRTSFSSLLPPFFSFCSAVAETLKSTFFAIYPGSAFFFFFESSVIICLNRFAFSAIFTVKTLIRIFNSSCYFFYFAFCAGVASNSLFSLSQFK